MRNNGVREMERGREGGRERASERGLGGEGMNRETRDTRRDNGRR